MTDRISELNSEIEALNQELKKQQEYNELFEKVKHGKPNFYEFIKLATTFFSQYDTDIPIDEGSVKKIKIERWGEDWTIRFTMEDSHFGEIVYDIDAELMNIRERIYDCIISEQKRLTERIKDSKEEQEELENTRQEFEEDLTELDEKLKTWNGTNEDT